MYGFRNMRCSLLVLITVLAITTSSITAWAQASHKTSVNGNGQSEASGSGAVAGVPWIGSPGITETVEEIMARQRLLDAQPHVELPPRPTKDYEQEFHPSLKPNPESPISSQWPAIDSSIHVLQTPFNPQTVGTNFLGAQISESGFIPPDSMGAVGPTQILVVVNGRIKVFDKAGVLGGLNATTDTFFASVRSAGTSDPHIRFDRLTQRWFVSMIDVATPNRVLLAVSSGSTITNTASFTFFQFQHDLVGPTPNPDTGLFADYDTLGLDANALYIGVNVFTSTAFFDTTGFVINKAGLIASTLTVTAFRQLTGGQVSGPYTPQGVDNDDPNSTEGYFIGHDIALSGRLQIRRISTPGGSPTISGNVTVTVPATTNSIPVPQATPGRTLDALDFRLFAAAIHKNKITGTSSLWTAHNIEVNSSGVGMTGGGRDGSRWYEITNLTTTPSLNQSGTLFDSAATNPTFFWIPSVAMSGQGHMALGSSRAGVGQFAQIAVAGRLSSDPLGTTQAPTLAQVSTSVYNVQAMGPQRWGDYSQTTVDPNDDMTMWTVQEYCNNTNSWGVRLIQLKAPTPATPSSSSPPSVAAGQSSVNVTITGTSSAGSGFFDPGPDTGGPGYPNHISATVSGTGVAVNSVTFTDPTHVTLNLNTTGATAGARNVTITNPDGQSTTGNGILTITSGTTPPSITKLFGAASIPVGASTSLTFTINNPNGAQSLSGLAFTDTLPAGLVVATPPSLSNTCGGTATATAGSSSVSLSGGTLAASASCTVSVNVTGTTAGPKSNSVTVTSTEGGTGNTSMASITVVAPPTISKSFGAATVALNQSVGLTFTITNPNGGTTLNGLGFTDSMPAGLAVAVVSFSNTCGASFSGTNTTTIVISGGTLAAGASCMVSGNVTGTALGLQSNSVTINSSNGGTGNTSSTSVTVVGPPTISEAFGVPSMLDTGTTTLTFTLGNPNASTALTGIGFTDPVLTNMLISTPNGLTGPCLTVAGGVTNAGIVTATSGSSSLSLSGLGLAASSSCTFTVNVTGNNPGFSGTITNTTNAVTSTNGGNGGTGSATIFLLVPPTIGKAFSPVTVPVNGTSTLTFTLSNGNVSGAGSGLTGMGFTDTFPASLVVATPNGLSNTCGGTPTATAGSGSVSLSGVSLTGGASCTLAVNVTGTTAGLKNNVSGAVTSNEAGPGNTASASLGVAAPPTISKGFNPTSVALNRNSTLSFTITNPTSGVALSGVAFTDILPAGLVVATPNSLNNACGGTATAVAGSSSVSLSGGTLAGSGSCTITVNITGTTAGVKSNTTGNVTSTESGAGTTSNSALLTVVAPPTISKTFGAPRIAVTGTAALSFTINDPNTGTPLNSIGFSDTLPAGLVIATPNGQTGMCGGGTITATQGTNVISLSGAALAAAGSCTFSVNVLGTAGGDQNNTTGNVTSTEGGTGGTASATINVIAAPTLGLAFNPSAIPLNAMTSLQFTITNPAANTTALNGVAFTDALPAGLTVANSSTSTCGGTLTTTNPTTISLSGATVNQNSQCIFSVMVTGTAAGNFSNIVSGAGSITSTTNGIGATGPPSNTATLTVAAPLTITKAFNPTTVALNTNSTLSFTITNPNTFSSLSGVAFTDNLPGGVIVASPPNITGSCGSGTITAIAGSGTISLSGGTLTASPTAGSSCTFSLNVTGTTAGSKSNTTGAVTSTEGGTGTTSNTAVLTVVAPPTISKAFGAASITLNGTTSLTFTITNPAGNTTSESGIAFADTLFPGLQVASPNGLTNNCGGAATAVAGSTSIGLSGGSIATPGANCTIVVNITGTATGIYTNTTGPISSTNGGTGATSNTAGLTVALPPSITKMFGKPGITVGGSTSLSFTINNPNTNVPLTGIAFNDPLPAGLVVSTPNGQTGSCGAGTITAVAGSGSISLTSGTLPASASCTFAVNVTGTVVGTQNNTTSAVTSNEGGNGNMATASINVDAGTADIAVTALTHAPDPAAFGGSLIFTATVTSAGPSTATVTLTETFTGNLRVVSATQTSPSPPMLSCSGIGGTGPVNCAGSIANGQAVTIAVKVTPLLGNSIKDMATITSDLPNPNPNPNKTDMGRVRIKARSLK